MYIFKFSSYLSKTELIIMQGELFALSGYYRKQLEIDKQTDEIEAQMWLVIVDLKDPKNCKNLVGVINGIVKFKIDLCKNQCGDQKVEYQSLGDEHFCVLKQHPDRSWFFEIDDDDTAEAWVKAMAVDQ